MKIIRHPLDHVPNRTLIINIDLLTICNNSCYYCYTKSHPRYAPSILSETKLEAMLRVFNATRYSNIYLVFLGGEPSLYPNFKIWIERCFSLMPDKNVRVAFATNCHKEGDWFSDIPQETRLIASFHAHAISPSELISKIENFSGEKMINFMLDPQQPPDLLEYAFRKFQEWGKAEIRPFFLNHDNTHYWEGYDFRKYEFIDEMPGHLEYDGILINDYQKVQDSKYENLWGYYCFNNYLTVNTNGMIFRFCNGEIFEPAFSMDTVPILNDLNMLNFQCKQEFCRCQGTPLFRKDCRWSEDERIQLGC